MEEKIHDGVKKRSGIFLQKPPLHFYIVETTAMYYNRAVVYFTQKKVLLYVPYLKNSHFLSPFILRLSGRAIYDDCLHRRSC
jgi:hypothetical protein